MSKSNVPGLNLADIAPMYEDVPIGDSFLRVHGISAKNGFDILQRFPKIQNLITAGFTIREFLDAVPDAVAAIIASASGNAGNEQAEEAAGNLDLELQFDILEAVGRLTFTKGFAPFATRIMALAVAAKSASSSKAQDTKLPQPSKLSSTPATPQT